MNSFTQVKRNRESNHGIEDAYGLRGIFHFLMWWLRWAGFACVSGVSFFLLPLLLAGLITLSYMTILIALPVPKPITHIGSFNVRSISTHSALEVLIPVNSKESTSKAIKYYPINHSIGLSRFTRLPSFLFRHLQYARIHTTNSVEKEPSPRPVVVFSHGLGGDPHMYSSVRYALASHGFVVITPNHSDGSANFVNLPNGEQLWYRPVPDMKYEKEYRSKQLMHRREELSALLSQLEEDTRNSQHALYGRLDMTRCAIVGHSFGGASAMLTGFMDARLSAVVSMDAWMLPIPDELLTSGFGNSVNYLGMVTEHFSRWPGNMDSQVQVIENSKSADNRLFVVAGTRHQDQSDFPLFVNRMLAKKINLSGPLGIDASLDIHNKVITAFLIKHMTKNGEFSEFGDLHRDILRLMNSSSPPFSESLLLHRPLLLPISTPVI